MKKTILMAMFAMFAMVMNAQTVYSGHKFWDNWSVGVSGGVQTNLHDWNAPQGGTATLHFDKQITPVYGLRFEGQVGFNNVANWLHPTQMHAHNGTVVDQVNTFLLGHVNLMNWWGGYKGRPRVFEVVPFAGVGYQHNFGNTAEYENCLYGTDGWIAHDNLLAKAGVSFDFNLGHAKAWTLNLRPAVVWNVTHNDGFDARYAVADFSAGVTYHFRNSNGTHSFVKYDIAELNDMMNSLRAENEALKNRPVEKEYVTVPVTETVTNTEYVEKTYVVQFAFDSAELSDVAVNVLNRVPEGSVVDVEAYASPEGSKAYNQALAERRAKTVRDYLVGRGVTVENAIGLGAVSTYSNRLGVVTVK